MVEHNVYLKPSIVKDHVLYTLQDRISGEVQGVAFVKLGLNIQTDLVEFVPLGNSISVVEDNQVPLPVSDRSINCANMGGKEIKESYLLDSVPPEQEMNLLNQSLKEVNDIDTPLQGDLNLSVTSSNNHTTLDECQSQSSYTSPPLMTREPSQNLHDMMPQVSVVSHSPMKSPKTEDDSSPRSQILSPSPDLKVKTKDAFEQPENVFVKIRPEIKESSPRNSNRSLVTTTIASLAAEVISKIKLKEAANKFPSNEEVKLMESKTSYKEKNRGLENEGILEFFERKRNAKQEMNSETLNRLTKPFHFGWQRQCVVNGSRDVTLVYYRTPPHSKDMKRKFLSLVKIGEFLKEVGETNLTLDNFSTKKVFYGFESAFELVRKPLNCDANYTVAPKTFAKTGWKYDDFYEVVLKVVNGGKQVKCLLCKSVYTTKGNFGKHMMMIHEPDETCDKCGLDFRPVKIQDHRASCCQIVKDQNENGIKTSAKRISITVSNEIPAKSRKQEEDYKISSRAPITISDTPKPVARKSLPHCSINESSGGSDQVNKSDECEASYSTVANMLHYSSAVPSPTFESPVVKQGTSSPLLSNVDNQAKLPNTVKSIDSALLKSASAAETLPTSISGTDSCGQMATLVLTCVEGPRVKMQVKVKAKVVKGMKKFGQRMGVSHEDLCFLLDGVELTGEELAGGLDGANIVVERKS